VTEPFTYLGPLRVCRDDRHWWHGPALFTLLGALVLAIGAVPFIGAILGFFAQLPIAIWLLGWTAKCQRDRYDGLGTLASPFDLDCLREGARAWLVMFLWSIPVVIVGATTMLVHFFVGGPSMIADYVGPDLQGLARAIDAIGFGSTVISIGLVLSGPILQIAVAVPCGRCSSRGTSEARCGSSSASACTWWGSSRSASASSAGRRSGSPSSAASGSTC
jgi:hypothetical protein